MIGSELSRLDFWQSETKTTRTNCDLHGVAGVFPRMDQLCPDMIGRNFFPALRAGCMYVFNTYLLLVHFNVFVCRDWLK